MNRRVMKTLIVDDEPIARRVLREELETVADVVIVGEAENGKQALQQISALQPDLVLQLVTGPPLLLRIMAKAKMQHRMK